MIRLRYDTQRNMYVDDVRAREIELFRVSYHGTQQRIERDSRLSPFEQNVFLEKQVGILLQELFPRKNVQPTAYALSDLGYFYTLDFLSAPNDLYVSLFAKEDAAK